jgi:hypothetical protein
MPVLEKEPLVEKPIVRFHNGYPSKRVSQSEDWNEFISDKEACELADDIIQRYRPVFEALAK